jgi:hypothetical protein
MCANFTQSECRWCVQGAAVASLAHQREPERELEWARPGPGPDSERDLGPPRRLPSLSRPSPPQSLEALALANAAPTSASADAGMQKSLDQIDRFKIRARAYSWMHGRACEWVPLKSRMASWRRPATLYWNRTAPFVSLTSSCRWRQLSLRPCNNEHRDSHQLRVRRYSTLDLW